MSRNDLQHSKFSLLLDSRLYLAPVSSNLQKILDLGTGSGIWAIEMAQMYSSAHVIGVDTAAVQPVWVPPNLQFEIDDIEDDWLWGENSFDFIHAREIILAIHDWPRLIAQAFKALRPGGYLQLGASVPAIASDDNTLPVDSAYNEIGQIYFDMTEQSGTSGRNHCGSRNT